MSIILESKDMIITEVKKKSNARMIKNLKVGDRIKLSTDAMPVGSNRGTYAAYIKIKNIKTGEYIEKSFNEIYHLYRIVDMKEA